MDVFDVFQIVKMISNRAKRLMANGRKRNRLKTFQQVTHVVYLHAILVSMHEKGIATEKEFDTVLQITLKHVLTQRFKQNTKWRVNVLEQNIKK